MMHLCATVNWKMISFQQYFLPDWLSEVSMKMHFCFEANSQVLAYEYIKIIIKKKKVFFFTICINSIFTYNSCSVTKYGSCQSACKDDGWPK